MKVRRILRLREFQLVLIDIAERGNARQQHGVSAKHVEKNLARHAAGTLSRQIERGLGQVFRISARRKAADQRTIDQSGDDGTQKTARRRQH